MARWFSPSDALACAAAGVGAWFTRASLDAFAGGNDDVRVAMLPAAVEIPGLVMLACLCVFLLRSGLWRARRAHPQGLGERHLLLPAVALAALAVPYLPWLPDAIPALRALAGPGRFALWALAFLQIAWCGADLVGRGMERRPPPSSTPARAGLAVLAISAGAAAAVAVVLARGGVDLARVASGLQVSIGFRIASIAALSLLVWLRARRLSPSSGSAAATWLAVATVSPFVVGGLVRVDGHLAAACVTLVAAWPAGGVDERPWSAALRGSALAGLILLVPAHVPLAAVLAVGLAWRVRRAPRALAAAVPLALAAAIAPFARGEAAIIPHDSLASVGRALVALLIDQQEGLLLHAPALALALPGLWLLWRDGGTARLTAAEAAVGSAAALLAAATITDGSRAAAIPGTPLLPALPLLVAPLARWIGQAGRVSEVAVVRLLVSWGAVVTVLLPLARGTGVLSRSRDGTSVLLGWLAPSRDLVRLSPLVAPPASDLAAVAGSALVWLACGVAVYWVAGRARVSSAGAAALVVTLAALTGAALGAVTIEAIVGERAPARQPAALQSGSALLDAFDGRRRPLAVAYDPWRTLPSAEVPPLFAFEAAPGSRRYPQPLQVLLNTRLSLPAGEYSVTLRPNPGATLRGTAGLQVGRAGSPAVEWSIAGIRDEPWHARFTLPVDASFVGLRTQRGLEAAVASLRFQPARVVNARDRWHLPTVVSAATYDGVFVTFHGEDVYAERSGFWVRGRATLLAAFAFTPAASDREPGVRLSVHAGQASTRVRFDTGRWATTIDLEPGVSRELLVPAAPGQVVVPVRISPDNGFVPAETGGGRDRRLLGCWIEVLN